MVRVVGFEPTACRFQTGHSDLTELHPDTPKGWGYASVTVYQPGAITYPLHLTLPWEWQQAAELGPSPSVSEAVLD